MSAPGQSAASGSAAPVRGRTRLAAFAAVILLLLAVGGVYFARESGLNNEARVTHSEFLTLKEQAIEKTHLIAQYGETSESEKLAMRSVAAQGDSEWAAEMAKTLERDQRRVAELRVELAVLTDRMADAEKQWGHRWRSLGLPAR